MKPSNSTAFNFHLPINRKQNKTHKMNKTNSSKLKKQAIKPKIRKK
jgi:hypothetical protein